MGGTSFNLMDQWETSSHTIYNLDALFFSLFKVTKINGLDAILIGDIKSHIT
jgi:hypothetical protein